MTTPKIDRLALDAESILQSIDEKRDRLTRQELQEATAEVDRIWRQIVKLLEAQHETL